jgi:hypothetical protein
MKNKVTNQAENGKRYHVELTEKNYRRLLEVSGALECRPELLMNNFLLHGLETPMVLVESMDFTEDGNVSARAAAAAAVRVTERAQLLDGDEWRMSGCADL